MALDAERLRALARKDLPFNWRQEQSALYALSIGFGRDPENTAELDYLLPSATQRAVPTMATSAGRSAPSDRTAPPTR